MNVIYKLMTDYRLGSIYDQDVTLMRNKVGVMKFTKDMVELQNVKVVGSCITTDGSYNQTQLINYNDLVMYTENFIKKGENLSVNEKQCLIFRMASFFFDDLKLF